MGCTIYRSATSARDSEIAGHVADDGNVYHSRPGEVGAENLDRCAGHIAGDGNVYSTARGFGESAYQCVGHIGADGRDLRRVPHRGEASGHCVGHIEPDGRVYDTAGPRGAEPLRRAGARRPSGAGRGGAVAASEGKCGFLGQHGRFGRRDPAGSGDCLRQRSGAAQGAGLPLRAVNSDRRRRGNAFVGRATQRSALRLGCWWAQGLRC